MKKRFWWIILALAVLLAAFLVFPTLTAWEYRSPGSEGPNDSEAEKSENSDQEESKADEVAHIKTPKPLKAIYMTSWVAGTRDWRASLVQMIEETELNAIVIDIKDDTGRISFEVNDPELAAFGSSEKRIDDLDEFLEMLHEKQIYVIGRVSVFQDPYLVSKRPNLAVKRASDGGVWKDRKGLSWLDAGSREVWDYVVAISREAHSRGFDEINFDYIRYPTDGNISDIYYPVSKERKRADVIEDFYSYLYDELGDEMTISADLFGLVTIAEDDLGIGQVMMRAMPYFDYICPMVYPSHFANGTFGYGSPAAYPYEIVNESMSRAIKRITATSTIEYRTVGTTTEAVVVPRDHFPKEKLRPWLQDFDLGADYDAQKVRAQIQATYDAGLDSWMLWDPSNRYTRGALRTE